MCDTYVPSVGYVCVRCQEDFKRYANKSEAALISDDLIISELNKFMETERDFLNTQSQINIDDFFLQYKKKLVNNEKSKSNI